MDPKETLERAQQQERRGQIDSAIQSYLRGGSNEDAARLLVATGRFGEAAPLLLAALGPLEKAPTWDAAKRKLALKAGICLVNAKDTGKAVDVFLKIGERARAVEALERIGDYLQAARLEEASEKDLPNLAYVPPTGDKSTMTPQIADKLERDGKFEAAKEAWLELKDLGRAGKLLHKMKKPLEAAVLFTEAKMFYEAAVCYSEASDYRKCLEQLVQVSQDDKRYRVCCVNVVKLANERNVFNNAIDQFLTKFLRSGPEDDRELPTFYVMGRLFQKHDYVELAKEAFGKIVGRKPDYQDVVARLAHLSGPNAHAPFSAGAAATVQGVPMMGSAAPQPAAPSINVTVNMPTAGGTVVSGGAALPGPSLPPYTPAPEPIPVTPAGTMMGVGAQAGPSGTLSATPMPRPSATHVMPEPSHPTYVTPPPQAAYLPPPQQAPSYFASPHAPPYVPEAPSYVAPQPSAPRAAAPAGRIAPNLTAATRADPASSAVLAHMNPGAYTDVGLGRRAAALSENDVIAGGRYTLQKKIGQGGMGTVFRAHDRELDQIIAIKFFNPGAADEAMLTRFKAEVTLSRELNHPNIIRLYDIGTWDDWKFISMELLQGRDLLGLMAEKPVPFGQGIDYLVQACRALEVVHERGIVHRDIKPDNFFITHDGVLKVMDFGIAKRPGTQKMTVVGMIVGTPQYMSPEQINDVSSVTRLTDLYALGVLAYQMFTATLPFQAAELMPLLMMHLVEEPRPPRSRNPQIPEALEKIILRLMAKDPKARFQTCSELAAELMVLRKQV